MENKYKVISFLNRQELDFLDKLEKDVYFTYGIHIPRTKLIEEIIAAFQDETSSVGNGTVAEKLLNRFQTDLPRSP